MPVIEEMGRKTRSIEVTAYLAGDSIEATSGSLVAAMQAAGVGRLSLPFDPAQIVHAEDFRRSREKDRMGYIAFDLRFVPVAESGGAALSLGDVASAFSSGLSAASAAFSSYF